MEMKEVVAPLKRVARVAVVVQTRATGNQDLLALPPAVVESLEVVPPETVFVDLVEDPKMRRGNSRLRILSRSSGMSQFR